MRRIAAYIICICLVLVDCSFAASTRYVSPTGTATWAASTDINQPTSPDIARANAIADDTVYFRGGTYDQSGGTCPGGEYVMWNPSNSGTLGHPITFKCYPNETCTIVLQSGCTGIGGGRVDYIVWDGFNGSAIPLPGAGQVSQFAMYFTSLGSEFRNLDLVGSEHNADGNTSLIRLEGCVNCKVSNNKLHGMSGSGVNTAAIWVFGFHGPITTSPCPGVVCGGNNEFFNNDIYDNQYGIMQKGNPNMGNKYYKNFIHDLTNAAFYLNDQDVTGVADGGYVYQNVIVRSGGIHIEGTTAINNYQVNNNTLYDLNATDGDGISTTSYNRNTSVWNNIVISPQRYFLLYYTGEALPAYSDYNNFYTSGSPIWNLDYTTNYTSLANWRTASGLDANSISVEPNFVNASGNYSLVTDFKRTEYTTNGRGGAYASVMGAYITGSEQIGYQPVVNGSIVFGAGTGSMTFGAGNGSMTW